MTNLFLLNILKAPERQTFNEKEKVINKQKNAHNLWSLLLFDDAEIRERFFFSHKNFRLAAIMVNLTSHFYFVHLQKSI